MLNVITITNALISAYLILFCKSNKCHPGFFFETSTPLPPTYISRENVNIINSSKDY